MYGLVVQVENFEKWKPTVRSPVKARGIFFLKQQRLPHNRCLLISVRRDIDVPLQTSLIGKVTV